jgi:phosphatidylserine/phosphatidylglycerophosphate/cardiolipin synthase-like enzyme
MSNPLFDLLKKTQNKDSTPLNEQSRVGKGTLQWFLEKDVKTHPIHNNNELEFLICSEGFAALEQDIRQATSTIDLVCWGFDPAMELTRMKATADPAMDGYKTWPRGIPYGDLLAQKATQGVKVRILLWYDSAFLDAIQSTPLAVAYKPLYLMHMVRGGIKQAINMGAANAPDLPMAWQPMPVFASQYPKGPRMQMRHANPTSAQVRTAYAKAWWHAALSGGIPNLEVRFRQGDADAAAALKSAHLPKGRDVIEEMALNFAATHHQKPVLIDYHPGQGADPQAAPNTCGYVMGLNSVTDYWDTPEHQYNDPRREVAFGKGAFWLKPWHLKPYRDYAMRVQGQALSCLNQNFVKSWDQAQTTHLAWPQASLQKARVAIQPPAVGAHRAQIVRTQPEDKDATILKTYVQACSNACNYIYIENQYFQLSEWVQFIKQVRQGTLDMLRKAGGSKEKLPPLHLMVISPQAERDEMVPRTYDALAQMGQAETVRGYHRQVQQVQEGKAVTDIEGNVLPSQNPNDPWDKVTNPSKFIMPLLGMGLEMKKNVEANRMEMLRRSAQVSQSQIRDELQELNIRTLAGMLMSYDHANEAQHLQVNARDNKAQDAQAREDRARAAQQAKPVNAHVRAAAKDEIGGDYSEYNIRPARYREIYIHSKLMLIDDSFITLGSANLNTRSMVVDSEINIASAEHKVASGARQRVWANLAGADLDGGNGSLAMVQEQFGYWIKRMQDNAKERGKNDKAQAPVNDSFIHTHDDPRDAPLVRLA